MARLMIAVFAVLAGLPGQEARGQDRMNILLFLVDDLGWQDVSVAMGRERTPLNDRYHTPNLERLAARGVVFSDAYAAAPVCTPSRTAIMTGRCPARTRITYWTLNKDTDTSRHRDDLAVPAWEMNGLQPGRYETLPESLRSVGYRTIHVGKAHFGAHDTPGADPQNLGFVVNIAGHGSGAPASYLGARDFSLAKRQGKEDGASVWDVPGLDAYHGQDVFLTEVLTMEAEREIRQAHEDGLPWFMNFAPYAVHTPIIANDAHLARYGDLDEREAAYASMIEGVDAALGELVEVLRETDQLDRTVIIFTSDNGGLSAVARGAAPDGETRHTHNAPLRSGKGSAYEGGTRVPLVIAWPGMTDQPDSVRRADGAAVVGQDLYPTCLIMAGLSIDMPSDLDGRELSWLISGRQRGWRDARVIGWNQPHQWGASGPGISPFTSIREGDMKLIYFHVERRFELYDLDEDVGEQRDLAGERPDEVVRLAGVMDAWIEETGAQLSIDRRTGDPIAMPGVAAEQFTSR